MERRDFLKCLGAAAAWFLLPGCDGGGESVADGYARQRTPNYSGGYAAGGAPGPMRHGAQPLPTEGRSVVYARPSGGIASPVSYARPAYAPTASASPPPAPAAIVARPSPEPAFVPQFTSGTVSAYARASWATVAPNAAKLRPMDGVSRITLHHDGNPKPNLDANPRAVAATLRRIQNEHRERMGAGDIGYHFIVDRSGQVWQGREEKYQGAHVSQANGNNLGILCLGNYDIQTPTPQQIASLERLVRQLMNRYRVPPGRVYCHRDLANTRCPGDALASQVRILKSRMT